MRIENLFSLITDRTRVKLLALLFGLILAAIVIPLQPIDFSKYKVELETTPIHYSLFYADLEGDGKAERFAVKNDNNKKCAVYVSDDKGRTVGQFNFDYHNIKARQKVKPIAIDFNNDNCKELIIFTQSKDSLFLNVIDYKNLEVLVENFFVTKIGVPYRDRYDYILMNFGSFDSNDDGVPEFYFCVSSGFALYPRRVYRYDYPNNELIASENTGAGICRGQIYTKGKEMMLLTASAAYGNIPKNDPISYPDSCCWIMSFDKDLNYNFTPKSIGSYPSASSGFIKRGEFYHFMYASNNQSNESCRIIKMDAAGNTVDSMIFKQVVGNRLYELPYKNGVMCFTAESAKCNIVGVDIDNLKITNELPMKDFQNQHYFDCKDIDSDGVYEYFFVEPVHNRLILFSEDFKNPIYLNYGHHDLPQYLTTQYLSKKNYGKIAFVTDQKNYEYHFEANPYYHFKYLFWILIYIILSGILYFLLQIQSRTFQKRQILEEEIASLQLQNLRNQLDPHFTFNALNSVGNAIYKENKEQAYDLFQRFTRMIRSSLLVSDKVFRSLADELQFTKDYLEFQKTRFKERFEYEFDVDSNVDAKNVEIPKMLIQSFAENAVKHAFHGVDYKGLIIIRVFSSNQKIHLEIEDNGIGINKSKELKLTSGTQKGEGIIQDQIRSINKLYGKKFSLIVTDKKDSEMNALGTIAKITF